MLHERANLGAHAYSLSTADLHGNKVKSDSLLEGSGTYYSASLAGYILQ